MRGWGLALLLVGCADDAETDASTGETGPVPVVTVEATVAPASPRAFADDLVCAASSSAGAPTLRWRRDGVLFEGELATTALPGDTVPGRVLRAGQRWTCEAVDGPGLALAEATVRTPSVLLILVDDLGVGDVGAYGGTDIPTPRLDALAADGVRFDAGYVTAPTCSPSRAGLITGRQQQRFGFEFNLGAQPVAIGQDRGLPRTESTLPSLLRAAGLHTGLVGKWHLGMEPWMWPMSRGFDGFFGFLGGLRLNLEPGLDGVVEAFSPLDPEPWSWPGRYESEIVFEGLAAATLDPHEHILGRFVTAVEERLELVGDAPFFLMWSLNTPHEPLQATPEMVALLPEPLPTDPGVLAYRATVAATDRAIGQVLDTLERLGQSDDTLVVFLSDNGCTDTYGWCSNAPLSGGKVRLAEGGIRVPMIAWWADRIEGGGVYPFPVSSLDLTPTFAAAVGADPGQVELDGVDLLPFLVGGATDRPHDALYWRTGTQRAVRAGDLKLVEFEDRAWLFDLATDPGETTDLSASRPDDVARLRGLLEARSAVYALPRWAPQWGEVEYYGEPVTVPF